MSLTTFSTSLNCRILILYSISASQFLGAPLKAIDPKFYESYMAFTKQSFGVLITTMTQWWSPTIVRVSGDKSLPKQLFHRQDGTLECRFPKRLVMMANHQVPYPSHSFRTRLTAWSSSIQTGFTYGGWPIRTTCTATYTSSSRNP